MDTLKRRWKEACIGSGMNTRVFLAVTTCFAVTLSAQQAETKGKMGGGMMDHMASTALACRK